MASRIWGAALVVAAACGGNSAASNVRPTDPTAAKALHEPTACTKISDDPEPLIVDWIPETRQKLELAMKDSIAVVAYDCKTLTVLPDCDVADGEYQFRGATVEERIVHLNDGDEVKANLPFSGGTMAAQLQAEFQRGSSLNLYMAFIGQKVASRKEVRRDELTGRCDGATHFVRTASLGAFAMQTGAKADLSSAAKFFTASASGSSTSSSATSQQNGDLDICKKVTPDDDKAPAKCGALLRLRLVALTDKAVKGKTDPKSVAASGKDRCPEGMIWSDDKCALPKTVTKHVCKMTDFNDCKEQCEKMSDAESCYNLGYAYWMGDEDNKIKEDNAKAEIAFKKSCDLSFADGCDVLGDLYSNQKKPAQAVAPKQKGCDLGAATACTDLAEMYRKGVGVTVDIPKALTIYARACKGGDGDSCRQAGKIVKKGGGGIDADADLAAKLFARGCQLEDSDACNDAAKMATDPATQAKFYKLACQGLDEKSCGKLADIVSGNATLKAQFPTLKTLMHDGCEYDDKKSCALACQLGDADACKKK